MLVNRKGWAAEDLWEHWVTWPEHIIPSWTVKKGEYNCCFQPLPLTYYIKWESLYSCNWREKLHGVCFVPPITKVQTAGKDRVYTGNLFFISFIERKIPNQHLGWQTCCLSSICFWPWECSHLWSCHPRIQLFHTHLAAVLWLGRMWAWQGCLTQARQLPIKMPQLLW